MHARTLPDMLSTARAASSPACADRRHQHVRPFLSGNDRGQAASIRLRAPRPQSVAARAASSSNPAGCLEAVAPWSGIARLAPPIMDDDVALLPEAVSSEERVRQLVLKQAALAATAGARTPSTARLAGRDAGALDAAFDRCGAVCKEYAKTFYLGT
jgi:phytoene synthase